MTLPSPPLLLVTDQSQALRPLQEIIAAALGGGCRWVSIREKSLPPDEQMLLARALLPLANRFGATLTLHGDPQIAARAGLGGVHLSAGADVAAARTAVGTGKIVGMSVHTATEAGRIAPAFVDYLLAGPAYETPSKPGYGPAIGGRGLAAIARVASVPVLAIGGINATRIGEVVATGAAGVAVMGSVMRASDPARMVEGLCAALSGALELRSDRSRENR